ncbi:MAG TPA: phosphatase PAP2 family protein [Pseudolabrys sp.]|nr:phosphatase PAP2 family protein [Pseudolabrys sp.]
MVRAQATAAWRLFTFNWVPVAAMAAALAFALPATGFSIKPASMLFPAAVAATLAGIYYCARHRFQGYERAAYIVGGAMQIVLIIALMTPLTYVAAAAGLPLQDANLAALDRALGFDWRGFLGFVNDRPWLIRYLAVGYMMIAWPVFGMPVLLGACRHFNRIQQFTLAFALALIATTILSILLPALGAYQQLGLSPADYANIKPGGYLDQLRDFPGVRDGSLRMLDLQHLVGIVTFPSFHAAAAVLYLWALWAIWWMRPIALLGNGLMLLATPIGGGHYFVDVFAGIGVAVLAIAATRWIGERVARPRDVAMPARIAVAE